MKANIFESQDQQASCEVKLLKWRTAGDYLSNLLADLDAVTSPPTKPRLFTYKAAKIYQ